jgi:hypothetical protein
MRTMVCDLFLSPLRVQPQAEAIPAPTSPVEPPVVIAKTAMRPTTTGTNFNGVSGTSYTQFLYLIVFVIHQCESITMSAAK